MNIVKIHGSIAQQMFQYAFYLELAQTNRDTFLHTPPEWLNRRFNLPFFRQASQQQLAHFGKGSLSQRILSAIRRPAGNTIVEPDSAFHSEYLSLDNTYFCGQWLSPAYFSHVADDIARCFYVPDRALPCSARHNINQLSKGETVALHIHQPLSTANVCTPDYYNWAVANILSYIDKPKFFVMTTDLEWAKQHINLQGADHEFMLYPAEKEISMLPYLSRAKHNISAATLTSWWAAWLNRNPDKITIAPQPWAKTGPCPDLIPDTWTTIPTT